MDKEHSQPRAKVRLLPPSGRGITGFAATPVPPRTVALVVAVCLSMAHAPDSNATTLAGWLGRTLRKNKIKTTCTPRSTFGNFTTLLWPQMTTQNSQGGSSHNPSYRQARPARETRAHVVQSDADAANAEIVRSCVLPPTSVSVRKTRSATSPWTPSCAPSRRG